MKYSYFFVFPNEDTSSNYVAALQKCMRLQVLVSSGVVGCTIVTN